MGKVILAVAAIGLSVFCLFDVAGTSPRRVPTLLPKWGWLLAVLVPVVGPAVWLLSTRARRRPPRRRPPVVRGPDDDPDFLRGLDRPEERQLRRWEAELGDEGDEPKS